MQRRGRNKCHKCHFFRRKCFYIVPNTHSKVMQLFCVRREHLCDTVQGFTVAPQILIQNCSQMCGHLVMSWKGQIKSVDDNHFEYIKCCRKECILFCSSLIFWHNLKQNIQIKVGNILFMGERKCVKRLPHLWLSDPTLNVLLLYLLNYRQLPLFIHLYTGYHIQNSGRRSTVFLCLKIYRTSKSFPLALGDQLLQHY